MIKSKLVEILRKSTKEQLLRIEDFVQSPYFNKDETVIQLFQLLKKEYPAFKKANIDKRKIFTQLYPAAPYQDKRLRYLMSDLQRLLEQFFMIEAQSEDKLQQELKLLGTLSAKGLDKAYRQVQRRVERLMETTNQQSTDYFQAQFEWALIREEHFERQRLRQFDDSIQHAAHHLDRYYYLYRLKLTCAMLDRQAIFKGKYELLLSEDWLQHLQQQAFFEEPIIRLYFTILQALQFQEEESYFERLKTFLKEEAEALPDEDLRSSYLFAINYCARKIRQGKTLYVPEALYLYKKGIETAILIEHNELSPWAFTNVVKLSLHLQRYEDVESFINTYAGMLPASFRENALHYNLAELYYSTQRFDDAQDHLNKVAYSDLNYYLGARVLLAKIFFETQEEEPLLSLLAAFTIFLKRNKKISTDLKRTYLNFCEILFQIIRARPQQMERLYQKIQYTALLTDRKWLLQAFEQTKTL
jgi:hypothetical protein